MPLTVVRSESSARLWDVCVSRVLALAPGEAATRHGAHLWIAHRSQRDLLLDAAGERGLAGWLAPPFSFFSELPDRFGLPGRPLGPLTGRMLLSRIAAAAARRHGFEEADARGRSHMVDRALSELLPEGVTADELEAALARLPADDFAQRRDRWLAETYRTYLERVAAAERFDPRSVHALVAERIRTGALPAAIGGAEELHVFGPTSLRGRRRLFEALAAAGAVRTHVYLPAAPGHGEWERLASEVRDLPARGGRPRIEVQAAPDAVREAGWVARRVKALLVEGVIPAHRVAVVARSGREDTRRIREALRRAGVPGTARLRWRLDRVPALRAVLQLFGAIAEEWRWSALRPVLKSPYFDIDVDLRGFELLASRTRPDGLDRWIEGLRRLRDEAASERGRTLERSGVTEGALERALVRLEAFRDAVAPLEAPRLESRWIEATRRLLRGRPLGMRERVCTPVEDRWDVVRTDQRGTIALEGLLREWLDLVPETAERIDAGEWGERLRRILESNEIALTTPLQRGVQVLEAHEAALTPFAHTFLVHANDRVFPRPRVGGLFTERERERLAGLGLPLATRALDVERERRLWLACAAAPRVTVSYWTADSNGVPRLPSLFVPGHDRAGELPRTRHEPAPDAGPALTRADLLEGEMLRLARERRSEGWGSFRTPDPCAVRHAVLGAFADELRCGGLDAFAAASVSEDRPDPAALFGNDRPLSERPTPWNGLVRDPAVLRELTRRYGDRREWSASQLEQYGRRPFDFLLERVLGLTETRTAEDEADRLTVGALIHSVLDGFYRDVPAAVLAEGGLGPAARERFEWVFEEVCDRYESREDRWIGVPHVWAANRAELRDRLAAFLAWELGHREAGVPIAVELAFGRGAERGPVDLGGPDREGTERELRLAGRIDRIDRLDADGEKTLRIVDYKSGGAGSAPSPRAFEDGAALQAVLYMAAAEALGLGRPLTAVYRTVRAPADRARRGPADVAPTLALARGIPPRIRAGRFEATQARSSSIADWQPGPDVTRSRISISSGTRFDPVAPARLPDDP